MIRFAFLLAASLLVATSGTCQQDSVVITGHIENLTGQRYREAPVVTFSRNNILQPQSELSRNAAIQADGSFRIAMPLIFQQEEMYLDYGGKVFATFLASKGTLTIRFDADSVFKTARLFRFEGVNARANNLYPEYLAEEARLFAANKALGADFFNTFWSRSLQAAKQDLLARGNLRLSVLSTMAGQGKQADELTQWVRSIVEDEQATLLMEYALGNEIVLTGSDEVDVRGLVAFPLTYQKVTRASRYLEYMERQAQQQLRNNPRRTNTLTVEKIARLVKDHVGALEQHEIDKLNLIIEKRNADKAEMDFLSRLYQRGSRDLTVITGFERDVQVYRELSDGNPAAFLTAATLVGRFYSFPVKDQRLLHTHLQKDLFNRSIKQSLEELVVLETRDSSDIFILQNAKPGKVPEEVLPHIFVTESDENGKFWLESIQKLYAGKPVYFINWDLFNEKSRRDLSYLAFLRQQLPPDVVFLYLHISDPDRPQDTDFVNNEEERALWKQYIARHHLEGTHLFMNSLQVMQLGLRYTSIPATYYIIKPNGRFHSRNAPSPEYAEEVVKAITAARTN